MKIASAKFLKSCARLEQCPRDGRVEIAFAGRSNVGKSTLLNRLLGKRGLAKTSKTPGKTRLLNFFEVNEAFYFVDLPGYGFAKVSKQLKEAWGQTITSYLMGRDSLRLVVHLIDSRHPPTPNDHELLGLLEEARRPTLLIATKFDKLKASARARSVRTIRNDLDLDEEALVIPVSSVSGEGLKKIWGVIEEALKS